MAKIFIRRANVGDYGSVRKLLGELANDRKRYAKKGNDSFHRFLRARNSFIDLAIINEEPVGLITYAIRHVVRHRRPIVEVEEFVVSKEFRGKKIGKRLMNGAIAAAKKRKCKYILLHSRKERKGAHEFYKRFKFEPVSVHFRREP